MQQPNSEQVADDAPVVDVAGQQVTDLDSVNRAPAASDSSSSSDSSESSSSESSDSDSGSSSDSSSESESDEEEEVRAPKRKTVAAESSAARKKRFRFLDVEADVGSGDEEDEEFIDDEGAAREAREGGRESRELELLRREAEQRRKAGGGNRLESVIKRLEEQAARQKTEGDQGAGEFASALVPQTEEEYGADDFENAGALFPTADDYKLFFVRMAEPGKEREAVIQLSHKAAAQSCDIRSVFCIDSLRGYIYIEAPSETVAKNFLMGIRKVQWYSLVVVPQSEMASVFRAAIEEASEKFKQLLPGEFVRVKRHPVYKGDLARVIECFDRDVEVALVPRIDWFGSAITSSLTRPSQSFFDDKAIESIGAGEIERLRNPQTGQVRNHFKNDMFTDEGFVVKRISRAALVTGDAVMASMEQVRWFEKENKTSSGGQKPISFFSIGDVVKVTAGDLKNLTGKVVLIDKQRKTVSIQPETAETKIEVRESEVEKIFKLSDHVKILTGAFAGDTGLVTGSNNMMLYSVLIDGEMREVKAHANTLELTSEVSKGELQFGNYALGQLVQFGESLVGLIVRISKSGNFTIISTQGKRFVSVPVSDLGGSKSSRDAVAVSRHGDVLKAGSVVKFLDERSLVKTGTVKEIYRNAVFIKEKEKTLDAGFTLLDAKLVELVASSAANKVHSNMNNFTGGAPLVVSDQPKQQAAPSRRYGANRLEGKRVRIIKGQYKGQLAQVREDHDTKVQVSLEAKFRVVTIPKDCVRLEDEEDDHKEASGHLNRPPMGSLHQPPQGYVPPTSTPFTPAPPHLSK